MAGLFENVLSFELEPASKKNKKKAVKDMCMDVWTFYTTRNRCDCGFMLLLWLGPQLRLLTHLRRELYGLGGTLQLFLYRFCDGRFLSTKNLYG